MPGASALSSSRPGRRSDPFTRRRWQQCLDGLRKSGLTVPAFCGRDGICTAPLTPGGAVSKSTRLRPKPTRLASSPSPRQTTRQPLGRSATPHLAGPAPEGAAHPRLRFETRLTCRSPCGGLGKACPSRGRRKPVQRPRVVIPSGLPDPHDRRPGAGGMQPEPTEPTASPLDRRDLLKILAGVGAANSLRTEAAFGARHGRPRASGSAAACPVGRARGGRCPRWPGAPCSGWSCAPRRCREGIVPSTDRPPASPRRPSWSLRPGRSHPGDGVVVVDPGYAHFLGEGLHLLTQPVQPLLLAGEWSAPAFCILTQAGPDRARAPGVLSFTPVSRAGGAPCDGFTWAFS